MHEHIALIHLSMDQICRNITNGPLKFIWKLHQEPDNSYRQISNISRTLVCNEIVYHSDVVGVSPVGAAPTTSSFST